MAKLVAFYSRADENYFGGQYRFVEVGNTEKVAHMIEDATGAELFKIQQKEPYSPDYHGQNVLCASTSGFPFPVITVDGYSRSDPSAYCGR